MKKILYILLTIILMSCESNHRYDGKYVADIMIDIVTITIGENQVIVENSSGKSKFSYAQFSDRIEYTEKDGVTNILKMAENGDLIVNGIMIAKRVK